MWVLSEEGPCAPAGGADGTISFGGGGGGLAGLAEEGRVGVSSWAEPGAAVDVEEVEEGG